MAENAFSALPVLRVPAHILQNQKQTLVLSMMANTCVDVFPVKQVKQRNVFRRKPFLYLKLSNLEGGYFKSSEKSGF